QEGPRRSANEQQRPAQSPENARRDQRQHDPPRQSHPILVGASAGRRAHPQRQGVRRISRNRRHSAKKQRRKRNEAAAPRDRIDRAAQRSRKKEVDTSVQVQAGRCTTFRTSRSSAPVLASLPPYVFTSLFQPLPSPFLTTPPDLYMNVE